MSVVEFPFRSSWEDSSVNGISKVQSETHFFIFLLSLLNVVFLVEEHVFSLNNGMLKHKSFLEENVL